MRDWTEVRRITGAFTKVRNRLSERRNLDELLRVLSDGAFAATNWGPFEKINLPYDPAEIAQALAKNGECMIYRRKVPKYEVKLGPLADSSVTFWLATKTPPKHWPAFFQLMDEVAAVLAPDFAGVNVGVQFGHPPNERDKKVLDLYSGNGMDGREYQLYGITGLCMRNYFGPAWVEQFGRDRMLSLPIPVKELPWGGIRTDLTDEPWNASVDELHAAWSRAMEHLRPTGVLAEWRPRNNVEYTIDYEKGPNSVIPTIEK